ncbi:hypothetical protein C0992_002943 [Termitomyces sp. T32_za158]|nr:hypothetical protein C0992_002943 [Termitomyces sp. T32_za158]
MASVFYAVSLGKKVGIFINRDAAALSLSHAKNDRLQYSSPHVPASASYVFPAKQHVSDDDGPDPAEIGRIYGPWFCFYIRTHGYRPNLVISLHTSFESSKTSSDFVDSVLSTRGMHTTEGKAYFIFNLMFMRLGAEEDIDFKRF